MPFAFCAVDYFGPWYIREGRREMKRHGVLFTCLSFRAIDLEVANSLSTDSFLNAYHRFVGRRGPVRQLRSDQRTNFVGARNELQEALSMMDHNKIQQQLVKTNCDWLDFKMNVPEASHMGGAWERQILLAKNTAQLDDEALRTFCDRGRSYRKLPPRLTIDTLSSPLMPETLTPNHLLTMKSKLILPPGEFQRADMYSRKRWSRVQFLANEFWTRWRKEYIQSLQPKHKWQTKRRSRQPDDNCNFQFSIFNFQFSIIVIDERMPRNCWKRCFLVKMAL
ncbi:uncharacterized protein [Montipora foliosa]|uniref:uncharacterized protein n=1 Tax=Montipora foliosa TaxID=591990 RepID=UPI0035F1FC3F